MIIEPTTRGWISQAALTRPGYIDREGRYIGLNPPGGHTGTDRAVPVGTELVAMADGEVIQAGVMQGPYYANRFWIMGDRAGVSVIVRHWFGYTTLSHCLRALVVPGQRVAQGQVVALSGNSGASTGPHVHYELLLNGFDVTSPTYGRSDPALYLSNGIQAAGSTTPTPENEDVMNTDQDKLLRRIHQVIEAQETDRIRERIVAMDGRTAASITRYIKGDGSQTVYELEDGVLRPITKGEFEIATAKGELWQMWPQAAIDALPGAVPDAN